MLLCIYIPLFVLYNGYKGSKGIARRYLIWIFNIQTIALLLCIVHLWLPGRQYKRRIPWNNPTASYTTYRMACTGSASVYWYARRPAYPTLLVIVAI